MNLIQLDLISVETVTLCTVLRTVTLCTVLRTVEKIMVYVKENIWIQQISYILEFAFKICVWSCSLITAFRTKLNGNMILGNCPTWRTNYFQCIYLFIVPYMFRTCHAHHQEKQNVSIQLLVIVTPCWWQCRVLVGSWDMGHILLLPLRRKAYWGFSGRPKNPTASAGFEPANSGFSDQYANH